MISGPIAVIARSYLYADGDASTPLRSAVLNSIAFWAVGLPLLHPVGIAALGMGWLASGLVEATVLGRAVARRAGAHLVHAVAIPCAFAAIAAAVGWWVAETLDRTLVSALAAGVTAWGIYLALASVFWRGPFVDSLRAARRIARASSFRERWA
jgi:peptidoglycan biosynthesis protein MviN/MurJ (putative lipid II flippase)